MTPQSTKPPRPPFADGSSSGKNFYQACFRAIDTYLRLGRLADLVSAELDNVTTPGVRRSLSEDDSLVIALMDFPPD
jgi:hypothetical protein